MLRARIDRERAVRLVSRSLVLCPERAGLEWVGVEQVAIVVERHRPETLDWRQLPFCESDRVRPRQGRGARVPWRTRRNGCW